MNRTWREVETGRIVYVLCEDPLWLHYEGESRVWSCDILDFYLWKRFEPV